MQTSKNHQTKGFSLVELSISIIIIGLLIGGISSGSTLIKQAEIRSIISDLRNYQTNYTTFKATYDAVPGDFNRADTYWSGTSCHATASTACNGDGDGVIRWRDVAVTAAGVGDEAGRALKHLALAGIMPVSIGQLTTTYAGGLNLLSTATQLVPPQGKSDASSCFYYAYNTVAVATTTDAVGENAAGTTFLASPWAGTNTNALFYGGMIQTANKSCARASLSALQALSVDQKLDDGAYNGTTAVGNSTGTFRAVEAMDPSASTCLTGGNYNVGGSGASTKTCFVGLAVQ
jgi:prepilin-type N-terminal cleavage/methylation domain-containing protein